MPFTPSNFRTAMARFLPSRFLLFWELSLLLRCVWAKDRPSAERSAWQSVREIGAWLWQREVFPAPAAGLHHPGSVAWAKRSP